MSLQKRALDARRCHSVVTASRDAPYFTPGVAVSRSGISDASGGFTLIQRYAAMKVLAMPANRTVFQLPVVCNTQPISAGEAKPAQLDEAFIKPATAPPDRPPISTAEDHAAP